MRITYYSREGRKSMAYFYGEYLVDVYGAAKSLGVTLYGDPEPGDLYDSEKLASLEALYDCIGSQPKQSLHLPISEVKLLSLLASDANNAFYVGRNYKSSLNDMNKATNTNLSQLERPAFFFKPNRAVVQSGEVILACSSETAQLDYEGEIGIVIGKEGKDISLQDAAQYIFGYTVCNDVSARDAMKAYYQMFKGKSFDTFAPIGPCITTKKEVREPLVIQTHINGELRQSGDTSDLIFDFPMIIHMLSKGATLRPGDIISTGTPAGIGAAMTPPHFLQHGDEIKITVHEVGCLTNIVQFY